MKKMRKNLFSIVGKALAAFFLAAVFSGLLFAEDPQKLFDEAKKAYDSENYSKAMDLFMEVITADPANSSAKSYLKKAGEKSLKLEKKKMEEERKKILQEVGARDKDEKIKKYIEAAQTYLLKNDLDNAEKEYKAVLNVDRNNQTAKEGIAYIVRQRRSPSKPSQVNQPRLPQPAQIKDSELQRHLIETEVTQRLSAANEAFNNQEFIKAEAECQDILKIQPDNDSALDLLVRIRDLRGRVAVIMDEAEKAYNRDQLLRANDKFNQVLDIDPENERARKGITAIQNEIQNRLVKGDFDSLQSRYYTEGFFYYNQKEYAKAIASWERAKSLQKSGAVFDIKNREIEEYIKKAKDFSSSKRDKERARNSFSKGMSAYKSGRYSAAVKYFQDAAWLDPSLEDAKKMLNSAEAALKLEESRRRTVKEPEPQAPPVSSPEADRYYTQGLMSYASGQLEDAIKYWEMCLRINPNHTKARKAIEKARYDLNESKK